MSRTHPFDKARRLLARLSCHVFQKFRILLYGMLSSARISGKPDLRQPLQAVGRGEIEFAGKVIIGYFPSPLFFSTYAYIEARNGSAKISIGEGTAINNGLSVIAEHTSISIGRRVLIGICVEIYDSDFHGLRLVERNDSSEEGARPVVVEDDVFLGSNVRVLKGVTIGKGSVIANSSVVVNDIPSGVIAGGNPARVIRSIEQDE